MQSCPFHKLVAVPLCAVLLLAGCSVKHVSLNSQLTEPSTGTTVDVGIQISIDPPAGYPASIDITQRTVSYISRMKCTVIRSVFLHLGRARDEDSKTQ